MKCIKGYLHGVDKGLSSWSGYRVIIMKWIQGYHNEVDAELS